MSEPLLAHANCDAAPSLQSISISRFPPDVDWRLHVEHRHVDADRRARVADLPAKPFFVSAGVGPVPGGDSDLPVHADRWRGGRPHRTAEDSAGVAVHTNG